MQASDDAQAVALEQWRSPGERPAALPGLVARWLLGLAALLAAASCGNEGAAGGGGEGRGLGGFEDALAVDFGSSNRATRDGIIGDADQVDVYDLGPLRTGDQVEAFAAATGDGGLDPALALFDGDGYRVFWNDDVDAAAMNYDASIAGPIRHDSNHHYLAVANSAAARTSGPYRLTIERHLKAAAGLAAPPARQQTFVLEFEPAEGVAVSGTSYGDLPAFDAANVRRDFAGRSSQLAALILEIVQVDYADFDVAVMTSDDPPPTGPFSKVFFGTRPNEGIFGIADAVDFYNSTGDDGCIVFVEPFGELSNNLDAVAQAIANVVSHEMGHTLGLMHNSNPDTLMDTTGADSVLLNDQSFGIGALVDFPIGSQNDVVLLNETVGPRTPQAAGPAPTGAARWRCGTCGATLDHITVR